MGVSDHREWVCMYGIIGNGVEGVFFFTADALILYIYVPHLPLRELH